MIQKVANLFSFLLVIIVVVYSILMVISTKELNEIVIDNIDLSLIEDGYYTGMAETTLVKVKVAVTVREHKIVEIELLKHENGRGSTAERVLDSVLESQSLSVDVISGATMSSKVILKSVEQAICK